MKAALRVIAGHGGKDPGAIADGIHELDLNIAAVLSFNDAATREYKPHDVTVVTYPDTDPRDGNAILLDKIAQANAAGSDQLLFEIHHNIGAPDPGTQIWTTQLAKPGDETWQVVPILSAELGFLLGASIPVLTSDRSRFGKLGIVDDTTCSAILIEARNVALVDTPEWEYSFGAMLARVCARYFGWPPAFEPPPPPAAPTDDTKLVRAKAIIAKAAAEVALL